MKTSITCLFAFVFVLNAHSQTPDSTKVRTKVEAFQSQTSSLIQREFIDIAKGKTFSVRILRLTVLDKQDDTATGVIVAWGITSIGMFAENGRSYLDTDEIDDLVKSLNAMLKMANGPIPGNYTELQFSTKSGFEISLFPNKGIWSFVVENDYRYNSRQYLTVDDLSKIRDGLSQAKSRL